MDFFTFDDEYVRRLREGDRWTVDHFYSYFQKLLLIKLRKRLRSMEEIDDVRQETYLRVFRTLKSPGGLREASKLGAFVNRVCDNVLQEFWRKHNRHEEPLGDQDFIGQEDFDEELIRSEERARVRLVISELPERDAAILREIFLNDRPPDEVCEQFSVDRNYLRVLLYRAKQKFREAWLRDPDPRSPYETDPDKPSLPN
jgi:RNA polymerase sigma-70 factor (ECF subfamily)